MSVHHADTVFSKHELVDGSILQVLERAIIRAHSDPDMMTNLGLYSENERVPTSKAVASSKP